MAGAMLSRSQSDVARIVTSPHADQIEDKPVICILLLGDYNYMPVRNQIPSILVCIAHICIIILYSHLS